MRVVFTQNFADHARGFHGLGTRSQAHFMHGKQNAALHRFLAIGHFR